MATLSLDHPGLGLGHSKLIGRVPSKEGAAEGEDEQATPPSSADHGGEEGEEGWGDEQQLKGSTRVDMLIPLNSQVRLQAPI